MVETKMAPEMPLSDAKEQHGQYLTERSYVPTVLTLLGWEKGDLEQPGLNWNGPLSLKLDAVIIAIEALQGAYGDAHD